MRRSGCGIDTSRLLGDVLAGCCIAEEYLDAWLTVCGEADVGEGQDDLDASQSVGNGLAHGGNVNVVVKWLKEPFEGR